MAKNKQQDLTPGLADFEDNDKAGENELTHVNVVKTRSEITTQANTGENMKVTKEEKEKEDISNHAVERKISNLSKSRRNINQIRPNLATRFDHHSHFPVMSNKPSRCKNEECGKKTFIHCSKCNVNLCLLEKRNCFIDFHTLMIANQEEIQKKGKKPKPSITLDKMGHYPIFSKKMTRCKNDECNKKTRIHCSKCKVALCIVKNRNCFLKFH